MKTKYVVGFLYSGNLQSVLLIEKLRPEWQRGYLNGIGGHIENGETPLEAMIREFKEETNLDVKDWEQFCLLSGEHFEIHFFFSFKDNLMGFKNMTDEKIHVADLKCLKSYKVIPNLRWLIPMSFEKGLLSEKTLYHIIENPIK